MNQLTDEIRKEIYVIQGQLRGGEGRVFKRVVNRYKSILLPVSTATKGVRTPLDAVHTSNNQIEIWLPEDLESHADSVILTEVLRYSAHIPGVKLQRTKGILPCNESGDWFVTGYVTELLSDQVVKKIQHSKDSAYSLGRACARVKLLMACLDQSKIPSKYLQIPERFLGGISQFKEPEITRALRSFYTPEDAKLVERLLQILSTHLYRVKKDIVRSKMDKSLFLVPESVVNMTKRRVSHTERTSRGKSKTIVETVTPTKPSQLASVAPWERSAISELYEQSWITERNLVESFTEKIPLDRDYVDFGKKLSKIFELQWGSKQKVLRATQHRLTAYPGKPDDQLYKKLNWIRGELMQMGSIEAVPLSARSEFDPLSLIPPGSITLEGGKVVPFASYLKGDEAKAHYPQTARLISLYEEITSKASTSGTV